MAVGEVSGLVDGRMDEARVEDHWAAGGEVEEDIVKEAGSVVEEFAEGELEEGRLAEVPTSG